MTSSPVSGISGWAERPLVGFQLQKNVIDLSDHDNGMRRQRMCRVVSALVQLCTRQDLTLTM